MSKKADRGIKRTCQNASCGARFYDLNRDPISCPICGSVYELAVSPVAMAAAAGEERPARRGAAKPEFVEAVVPGDVPEVAGDDALVDAGDADDAIATDDDETFLEEEEEDGGDVSGIIGGPVSEEGEEP
ncbi:MAG: TIGR02300 family protein [Bacteroidota bacterium]|jgi:uncharacterized protein (TIGR02300 family)